MTANQNSIEKITLKDIAKRVNRSVATVSLALSGNERVNRQTRDLVQNACKELGYFSESELENRMVDKELQKRKQRFCLVVFGANPWQDLGPFLDVMLHQASELGVSFEIKLVSQDASGSEIYRTLESLKNEVDGLILIHLVHKDVYCQLHKLEIPIVMCGLVIDGNELVQLPENISIVTFDAIQMGRIAAINLLQKGHKRIAFTNTSGLNGLYFNKVFEGYCLGLIQHSIPINEDYIITGSCFSHVRERIEELMNSDEKPDGIVTSDSYFAGKMVEAFDVDPEDICMTCVAGEKERQLLKHCPKVLPDWSALARTTFTQLDLLIRRKIDKGTVTYTPFYLYSSG